MNILKKRAIPALKDSNEFLPISHESARDMIEPSICKTPHHLQTHNVKLTYPNGIVLQIDNVSDMGCCKGANVDFRKWMIYFLDHVHSYDEDCSKDIADLLPDRLRINEVL